MRLFLPVLISIYFLVYILPLGVSPAFVPDETRYAEISREMLNSEDYIVPRINGLRYFEKPVLGYWFNSLSIHLFGENSFAIRFPSALSAGLSALMVYILGYMFAGGITAGFFSAAIFLTFMGVFVIGQFSVLDSMFSLFVTAGMIVFRLADTSVCGTRKRFFYLLILGILTGLAFLVKGFLAFVIPIVSIAPFLIWEKRVREILSIPWLPLAAAIAVSLPWALAIHAKEPDYWNFFIFHEHIKRFMGENAQHSQPFWYFILVFPALALPWTFLFPAMISGMKKEEQKKVS